MAYGDQIGSKGVASRIHMRVETPWAILKDMVLTQHVIFFSFFCQHISHLRPPCAFILFSDWDSLYEAHEGLR
jgi:hypothetical protein